MSSALAAQTLGGLCRAFQDSDVFARPVKIHHQVSDTVKVSCQSLDCLWLRFAIDLPKVPSGGGEKIYRILKLIAAGRTEHVSLYKPFEQSWYSRIPPWTSGKKLNALGQLVGEFAKLACGTNPAGLKKFDSSTLEQACKLAGEQLAKYGEEKTCQIKWSTITAELPEQQKKFKESISKLEPEMQLIHQYMDEMIRKHPERSTVMLVSFMADALYPGSADLLYEVFVMLSFADHSWDSIADIERTLNRTDARAMMEWEIHYSMPQLAAAALNLERSSVRHLYRKPSPYDTPIRYQNLLAYTLNGSSEALGRVAQKCALMGEPVARLLIDNGVDIETLAGLPSGKPDFKVRPDQPGEKIPEDVMQIIQNAKDSDEQASSSPELASKGDEIESVDGVPSGDREKALASVISAAFKVGLKKLREKFPEDNRLIRRLVDDATKQEGPFGEAYCSVLRSMNLIP